MEKTLKEELYESIRVRMKDVSTDDLKKTREELMKTGKMTDELLNLFNEELADRAVQKNKR